MEWVWGPEMRKDLAETVASSVLRTKKGGTLEEVNGGGYWCSQDWHAWR